jgi:hypothetical protein
MMNTSRNHPLGLQRFLAAGAAIVFAASCQWGVRSESDGADGDLIDGDVTLDTIDTRVDQDVILPDTDAADLELPPECTTDAQCDDGDPCSGQETCSAAGTCQAGTPLADGTDCERSGVAGTCSAGRCVPTSCGNSVVDAGEECDDGNAVSGDGCDTDCSFSCHDAGDCSDDNVCTTDDCVPNDLGRACTYENNTEPCDDGLFCTLTDQCDGSGTCAGSGSPCGDDLDCTINEGCDDMMDRCTFDMAAGTCLIAGVCYDDGDPDPGDECRACRSASSIVDWSPADDMTACTGGVCCGGVCRPGGECCVNADCPTAACTGTATACGDITAQALCEAQTGCAWVPSSTGECTGTNDCDSFTAVPWSQCTDCGCRAVGCHSGICNCSGAGSACNTLTNAASCTICGCDWVFPNVCMGAHPACATYMTQAGCDAEDGCSWSTGDCVAYTCQ